ncbi:MAG: asparaginase [Chloroflexota bacterium]
MSISVQSKAHVSVPNDAFAGDQPLVAVMRGEYVGSLHRGTLALVDSAGVVALAIGDIDQPVFLRSAAKPFQVLPAILAGGIDQFGISERELAVLCASHSAEPRHTDAVLSVLHKLGLDESALHCGVHPPLHEATARSRWRAGLEPTPACNNCSGAHTGMLVACRARGWSIEDYGDPNHPLQLQTRQILAQFAGLEPEQVTLAGDNCHVPTFRLSARAGATAFARLVTGEHLPEGLREPAALVTSAMSTYPEMVAGEDRFDSDVMVAGAGDIVAKGGAEGYQGIGIKSRRLGLGLKISDGNSRATAPAVMPVLSALGVLSGEAEAALESYSHPISHDHQGEIVGQLTPIFSIHGLA